MERQEGEEESVLCCTAGVLAPAAAEVLTEELTELLTEELTEVWLLALDHSLATAESLLSVFWKKSKMWVEMRSSQGLFLEAGTPPAAAAPGLVSLLGSLKHSER